MPEQKSIYLDNAATTALDERVLESMLPFLRGNYGNPSSVHAHGRLVRAEIEKARKKIAQILNANPGEIIFTSGGTEADNMAILGAIQTFGVQHIITSPLEHHAVLHTVEVCAKMKGITYSLLETDAKGQINLNQLDELLKAHPKSMVSLMHGNNEIGNLLDIRKIGDICQEYGAYFHSDTVQTVGHYRHDVKKISQLNALTGAAHKFHGPKGVGFLYINQKKKIGPMLHGGSQERNMRGGTENVAGIIGMAKALEIADQELDLHQDKVLALKRYFAENILEKIPGISFNGLSGDFEKSLYTVLNVSFPESEKMQGMLLFHLDLAGISVSGGSACSSGATLGSHVLRSLNASPNRETVRFSFSRFNSKQELDYTLDKIQELYS